MKLLLALLPFGLVQALIKNSRKRSGIDEHGAFVWYGPWKFYQTRQETTNALGEELIGSPEIQQEREERELNGRTIHEYTRTDLVAIVCFMGTKLAEGYDTPNPDADWSN